MPRTTLWKNLPRLSFVPACALAVLAVSPGGCRSQVPEAEEVAASRPAPRVSPGHESSVKTDSIKDGPNAPTAHFSWQDANAKVLPTGDLEWTPRPFRFEKGASVRYIDFDKGDDAREGTTRETAWKHHPWDAAATGSAKACTGIHTYVFKGGTYYRGELTVRDAGQPGNPIRLTRDPSWGKGEAVICGSEIVKRWTKGADHKDIPEPNKVWYADLDYAPRCVWMVGNGGDVVRIPLARTPNWKVSNPDDVKSEWWSWDMPRPLKWFGNTVNVGRNKVHLAGDSKHLKGKPKEWFEDAIIYPEFGWVIGEPYATRVRYVDTAQGSLGFGGRTGNSSGGGVIMRAMRYYLEDKPHYLDDPDGEFWFDKKGDGGRLYLRLPGGADPNTVRIEAARRQNLVSGKKVEHVHLSGLTFRFTGPIWDLTAIYWDFSTKPWKQRADLNPACVRVWGEGRDIRVANCRFEHVFSPIRIRALEAGMRVEDVLIEDNDFRDTDDGVLTVGDGAFWGYAQLQGRLGDVRILRNHSCETGHRPSRLRQGTAFEVEGPRTVEIAGNVIERSYAQGIDVHGAKPSGCWGDVPFTRILIHHNKVWESMLNANDYGGIETWQGGPAYVFNNLSYNAQGMQLYNQKVQGKGPGFGHAYYLDGAFKNYHFNNIAWGRSKDETNPLVNCAAFQEIISYQNTFFNNTAYNYYVGSRRQAPQAGRDKFLGNLWESMGKHVFRHADPAKTEAEGNAADAGPKTARYALETDAYGRNLFHDIAELGVLEPSGRWLLTFHDFKSALEKNKAMVSELGEVSPRPLLRNPGKGDFRPAAGSAARGSGVRVFVPWALSGVVAEWSFYHPGDNPASILDEHWYMTDYFVRRDGYYQRPMYSLKAVNVGAQDYVQGPLEDWISGALRLNAARRQYAVLSNAEMMKPFSFNEPKLSAHEGGKPEPGTVQGEALKNPQIYTGNLLIEAHFKTATGHARGVLIEKMKGSGYSLAVGAAGRIAFSVRSGGQVASIESAAQVNDGRWHHVVVEADRKAKTLTVYVDGKEDASGAGLDGTVSLANEGDLFVGGTPEGRHLDGTLEFMRLAHGTLADAHTTIEELYAWQFSGPFLRDFTGRTPPQGQARNAGAIHAGE